jgi:hypothetical protein
MSDNGDGGEIERELHPAIPISGDPIDDLPPELEADYELMAQFRGYIRQARVAIGHGDLMLTIGVPFEDKYKAMGVTDLRGTTFLIGVYKPIWRRGERAGEVIEVIEGDGVVKGPWEWLEYGGGDGDDDG